MVADTRTGEGSDLPAASFVAGLQHGFSLQPVNINVQVHPGYEMVVTIKPDKAGEYGIVCNEYCGLGHHMMVGKIYVVE